MLTAEPRSATAQAHRASGRFPKLQFHLTDDRHGILLEETLGLAWTRWRLRARTRWKRADNPLVVYHNIGFTGSSSFASALGQTFDTVGLGEDELGGLFGDDLLKHVAARTRSKQFVSVHTRAPNLSAAFDRPFLDLQLLRIPERVYVSIYYWHRKLLAENRLDGPFLDAGRMIAGGSFEEYVASFVPGWPNTVSRGILISMLDSRDFASKEALIAHANGVSDQELYRRVRGGLIEHGFVGVAEHMSESLFAFLLLLGRPHFPFWPKVGVSSAPTLDQIEPRLLAQIGKHCEVDRAIYDEFCGRLLADFAGPIAAFRAQIGSLCEADVEQIAARVPAPSLRRRTKLQIKRVRQALIHRLQGLRARTLGIPGRLKQVLRAVLRGVLAPIAIMASPLRNRYREALDRIDGRLSGRPLRLFRWLRQQISHLLSR